MGSKLFILSFVSLFATLVLGNPSCPNTLAFYNPNLRSACYNASESSDPTLLVAIIEPLTTRATS